MCLATLCLKTPSTAGNVALKQCPVTAIYCNAKTIYEGVCEPRFGQVIAKHYFSEFDERNIKKIPPPPSIRSEGIQKAIRKISYLIPS